MRTFTATAPACAFVALLAGCATPGQVADQVVRSNLGQEQAHNRLLLLNVVRAYRRMPMHFSKVTAVRLPLGLGNPEFTIPTPWGPDYLLQTYNISTKVALQQGVDSIPMDSQEFMRGVTTPVTPGLMLYYLDQGWPQQLILHMFVRSIEIYEADAKGNDKLVDRITNYPQNPSAFKKFQDAVQGLQGCELDGKPDRSRAPYGPTYQPSQLGNAEALAAARTADLALLPVDAAGEPTTDAAAGYRFFRELRFTSLRFSQSPIEPQTCVIPGSAMMVAAQSDAQPRGAVNGKTTAVFILRSPEAMIYYLGEIARTQIDSPTTANADAAFPSIQYRTLRAGTTNSAVTLFQLRKGADADSAVVVEHEGETFSVPKSSSANRSMHVLSLVTQIIGLQNKGTDPPGTANVRLVP